MAPSTPHSNSSSQTRGPASKVIAVKGSSKRQQKPSRFTPPVTDEESSDLLPPEKSVKKKTVPPKQSERKENGYDADTEQENKNKLFIEKKSSGKDKVAQVYQRADGLLATEKRRR
ncbi:hypothetical protein BHYA_0309g00060 [Botrytis hyacinthi]|uniref:Uncharacterized protein n=1 Tax=Botrytis hyacinthi TaxID=278943 RepID=A0A4Z1G939_9HELO|nr:hypothetical protein BHYA_0309g00060 [Botrytis hyacinthi]